MYEKINDDWNEIGEIGGKARDLAASKSHVIIATDKGIYSRGKNDYGFGSIKFLEHGPGLRVFLFEMGHFGFSAVT